MSKIKLTPPQGYSELDSASVEQFGKLLLGTYEGDAINQFNDFLNSIISDSAVTYTSIDSAAQFIADDFAESGQISSDSAFVLVQNAMWDNITNTPPTKGEKDEQKDLQIAGSVGALIGMENARKQLKLDDINKADEFSKIKKHYGLDETATKDVAYGMLLEDLEASELATIFKQGELGTLSPIPLSADKWEEQGPRGQVYGGMAGPQFSVGKIVHTDVKFTEELFENYIYREKKNELIKLAKSSGETIDYETFELTAKSYARDRAKKGFELYQDYQVEVLKDVGKESGIDKALVRLASKAELERQKAGIFTDDI